MHGPDAQFNTRTYILWVLRKDGLQRMLTHSPVYDHLGNKSVNKCPFCRSLHPTTEEALFEMKKKQAKANNAYAVYSLGIVAYLYGRDGLRWSRKLAMKLWHWSGDLGCADAYLKIDSSMVLSDIEIKSNHCITLRKRLNWDTRKQCIF